MGCCESNDMQRSGTFNLVEQFRRKRDKSAPLLKKPIFDNKPSYQSNVQFKVSKPVNYSTTYRTASRIILPQQQPQRIVQQSFSCPPQQQQYILNPKSQEQYHKNYTQNQSIPIVQQFIPPLNIVDNNVTFNGVYINTESDNNQSFNNILSNLSTHQQKLFKTASNAILSLRSDTLDTQDKKVMNDIFVQLEKSSFLDSRSSKGSLNQNSKELHKMYSDMNNQLKLLNQLISCLESKMDTADRQNVKSQLKTFANQVQNLGQLMTKQESQKTIKQNKKQLISESQSSTQSKLNKFQDSFHKRNQFNNQIGSSRIVQQNTIVYHNNNNNNNNESNSNSSLNEFNKIESSRLNNSSQSSVRMQENNKKIDNLISKLHNLNDSYRRLTSEDDLSIDISKSQKENYLKIMGI